jgi:tryptophan synthase alpha chain
MIFLLAPTSGPGRIRTVARAASGFLYFVSVLGVTGARGELPSDLPQWVRRVRAVTDLPVGVGFGVSSPEQAAWIAEFADAVIVGSAFARIVEEAGAREAPARVAAFTGSLRQAMRTARAQAAARR